MLTVLDKNEKPIGITTPSPGTEVREVLTMGETVLSFSIPQNSDSAKLIELENFIVYEDQKFIIKQADYSESGKKTISVKATHVYIELIDEYIPRVVEFYGVSCQTAVNEVLFGTDFSVGSINAPGLHDIDLTEINVLKALQMIREKWNVDLWFDNRTVHLGNRSRMTDVEIKYGKNLKALSYPSTTSNIITRLYVYGKDGLTLEGLTGLRYVDSPYIGMYRRPKRGEVRFNDIDDPSELLYEAQKYLDTVDKIQFSYKVDFLHEEDIRLGDVVHITHTPFGIDRLPARIVDIVKNPFDKKTIRATLSSAWKDMLDQDADNIQKQQDDSRYINRRVKQINEDLSEQYSMIEQTDERITLEVGVINGELQEAFSQITINATEIQSKVSQTDYNGNTISSLINQTATTIKIQASKINLVGAVTVLSEITGNLGTITGGTINGITLNSISPGRNVQISNGRISINDMSLDQDRLTWDLGSPQGYVHSIRGSSLDLSIYSSIGSITLQSLNDSVRFIGDVNFSSASVSGLPAPSYVANAGYANTAGEASEVRNGGTVAMIGSTVELNPSGSGLLRVLSAGSNTLIQHQYSGAAIKLLSDEVHIRNGSDTGYRSIHASAFTEVSNREYKKNIEIADMQALDGVISTQVHSYHHIDDLDNEFKRIGLIVDEAPAEVVSLDGVGIDMYHMVSYLWRAIQELYEKVEVGGN
ncbi:hypothetical protein KP77_24900 [Jeotgalibacillus alimentarius]|uniref:Peptidase S74 domain-containing protein n=1 Tax=Jeotgalibacillus alimentarius TaxID=135826 RepID=A0A0C2VD97_9BACL|nr:phage tail spike protein [Jeotgalibacillus alimentarius]KIL46922.1 hypothetical protein KP77_24900 [Jeotgalibacillus alimentarius]